MLCFSSSSKELEKTCTKSLINAEKMSVELKSKVEEIKRLEEEVSNW
jgi:hypothetical protein